MALPPATARARSALVQASDAPPRGVRFSTARLGAIDALVVEPREVTASFELLYFHGGAFCFGSPEGYRGHLGRVARAVGGRVTAPRYRLAPEHRFPAALDDAIAAHQAMTERVGAERVIIAGDSAGAALGLSAVVAARVQSRPTAAGVILLSPWCDLSASTGSVVTNSNADWGDVAYLNYWSQLYLGPTDARDPRASPVYADLRGLPPLRVLVGDSELVRDQATALVDRARALGVDAEIETWPRMVHAFWMLAPAFPAQAALNQVADWCRELRLSSRKLNGCEPV